MNDYFFNSNINSNQFNNMNSFSFQQFKEFQTLKQIQNCTIKNSTLNNPININKDKSYLKNMRITVMKILFVIGLPKNVISQSHKELAGKNYFGHYGNVVKVSINDKPYDRSNKSGPIYSMHVNYSTEEETCLAMLALHEKVLHNSKIKTSFGTTKYCNNFIENKVCYNKECLYHHKYNPEQELSKVKFLYRMR